MDALIPDYPNFVKGQVLTSQTLNGLVAYFDTQDIYTRIFLLGSGIFYGLEVTWNATENALHISPGVGVSSDGDLFPYYEELVLHTYSVENVSLAGTPTSLPVLYDTEGQAPLSTLFNTQTNNAYVILLLWDETPVQQESCMNSYANSPVSIPVRIKAVAITVEALATLRQKWPVVQVSQGSVSGDDPFVHRFGYQASVAGAGNVAPFISFDGFTSWDAVKNNFTQVCTEGIATIALAYQHAYQSLFAVLQLSSTNPFDALADKLKALLTSLGSDADTALPYFYDYLKNLVSAYQELAATDAYKVAAVMPDPTRFPGYIALGGLNGQAADNRMALYRPPLADLNTDSLDVPAMLLQRMIRMADNANTAFTNWTNLQTLYITPDRGLAKAISKRAIPFYFNNRDTQLLPVWSPAISRQNRLFTIPGIAPEKDRELLLRDMDAYGFFRVQGHIGMDVKTVLPALQQLRKELHLPFDIRVVYLGTEEQLQQVITQEIGLFTDIDLWLEKIVADIRCNNLCGTNYEDAIFRGASRTLDYANMLVALADLFSGATSSNFTQWSTEMCRKLCPNGNFDCCAQHLRMLYDLYTEYLRRKTALLPELLFHRFAQSHPGLEHNAGVPKGGTLVLVANAGAPNATEVLLRDRLENSIRSLSSLSDNDKAMVLTNLQNIGNFSIVADFCLPYTCCSKTPSIEIIFREAPPVAAFTELNREPAADGGYKLTLQNNSLNATNYKWLLLSDSGQLIKDAATSDVSQNMDFELLFKTGFKYTVKLTAINGAQSDATQQDFNICPNADTLQLNRNGNDEFEWTQGSDAPPITLTATPMGGTFRMDTAEGLEIDPTGFIKWNDDGKSIQFDYSKLKVNTYTLYYEFQPCDASVNFGIIVDEPVETPKAAATGVKAMYNKRAQQYRQAVAQAGDADKNLAKTDKFGQTTAFLRFAGKSAELDKRYGDLQQSLQSRLGTATPQRQQQVLQLLASATAYYLDRQLIDTPTAVPDSAKTLLQSAAAMVKEYGGAADTLVAAWAPDTLQTEIPADLIKNYNALLTA